MDSRPVAIQLPVAKTVYLPTSMDHCGNQVFDAVDRCSTTNLKTNETLMNFMGPSRNRQEPDSELSLGLSSTERFKDEAIPDIRKSFFTIAPPDITAEVCGADAKLFPPEVCGAGGGGALGSVFGEVLKTVEEVTIKAIEFKPLLNRLQSTLNVIAPIINDIEPLERVLDWPPIETKMLVDKLEEGKRLVQKCAKVRWWNLAAKALYTKKLIAFDKTLVRFFCVDLTAQISRDSRKIKETVNVIDGRLERIKTRVEGGRGVQQEVLPRTPAELSPYVVDCDDFEDFDDFDDSDDDVDDSDDDDRSAGMLPNLEDEFVHGLLSSCGYERIIISTTNHRDRHDAALLPLVNVDSYIHTSAPRPIALPDGGEIVQLESSEQKPLVDFDATNNRSCQREASMRPCMTESVLSLVDSVTRISSTDFDAPENRAHLVRAHQSSPIVFNSEKEDAGEGLNGECLTKSVLSSESSDDSTKQNSLPEFDAIENKVVKVYARRGRGCCHSMELEQVVTFAELGTDPENEGIISDLLRFVRDKEFYKSIGKAWKRGYLFNDSPGTDRSGLIAAMANCLEFDIYDLDLTGLSSISELTHVLVSIRNRSFVVIKDFDRWIGMLPNLKNELTLSGLLKIIHGLLSSCGDERIIVLSTSHNHRDPVDATLLHLLNIDLYIHTSSPQPIALPDVGEIVRLDSSEQKPSVDFGATNNWAYQSNGLVSNSEEKNTREVSRRQCMTQSVLGLVYPATRISSTDFDAPDNSAHLVRAYLTSPVVFNLEKKDTGEGLNRECLTKGVLGLDNSSKQKSLLDVDTTENKAHLVSSYQSGSAVSLSENNSRGEALKRECISKSILGSEDLQQHSGVIYDPGIHTTDSLAWKSFKVLETLPTREQPNDCVPLLSLGRLTLKGCVQEEKSPDLPTVMQINGVEHRVKKLPTCLGGLTAQSTRSSHWPIGLPDGRHIVLLDQVEQSTKNVAHGVRADKCSPTVSLPEKKMMRKTWKRKCRTMNVVFESHQHFGRRCEGAAKRFRAKHICRKHGINQVSVMKRHKQHGIHQWPFRQKWATRKGYSLGDKRPYEVSSLSMDEKLDSRLLLIHMSKFARSSPQPLALPDGGEITRPIALSSSECAATNNISHLVGQDQSGSTTSHYERKNIREMSQGITMSLFCEENLQQPFGCKHKDAVKRLDVNVSMFKGTCRQQRYYWWLCRIEKNEQEAFNATNNRARLVKADQSGLTMSTSEKEDTGEALKRECITKSVLNLENLCQHYGVWFHTPDSNARKPFEERQELQFHTPDSLAWKSFEELNGLPLCKQSNCIRRVVPQRRLALKRWVRLKKSQDLPGTVQMNCSRGLTTQSARSLHGPIGLPDGGHNASLSKMKIVRKTFKRKCRAMNVSFEDHQQHFSCRCEGAVNSLGAKHICKQHEINLVPTAKHIRGQHWIHRCPFRQSTFGLPDGGHILPLSEKKIVRKTLKRKCRSMSVLSLVDRQQHVDRRWEDAAKNIGAKRICRQLVIHRVPIAKRICRQHGIHHQWPFQQDWATMKGYSLGDKRPVEVIRLSIGGKLVSRLRRIYISWLDRFSPRPLALPRGGLIVGPIALSSSEFAATNNLAQRVGQDQRGSGASGSENEGTREQEDPEEIRTSITKNDLLQLHGRMTRKDAAAILHVSESTVKRKWKECKMGPWKNGGRRRVWKPPDQHGEGNTSTACETPSHNVQTGVEGDPVGQNQEANECRRDFMGRQIALNPESGLIMVSRPPDQHVERNTSTARETPSHNVQTGIEGVPVGQNQEANEFRPDFTEGSIPLNTENGSIIGSSSEWASQVNDQSTLSTPYQNHNALVFPQPQITSMLSDNRGGSIDWRNSLASLAEPFSDRHISGSSNLAFPTWSDQAAPSQHAEGQSVQSTVYPDYNAVHRFPEGHVFESIDWNEHTNSLASQAEPFSDRLISRSIWRPPDQLEGQTMLFTAHPNALGLPQFQIASSQVPSANEDRIASQVEAFFMGHVSESSNLAFPEYSDAAARSQPVATILTERQDPRSVKVKATYGNGNRIIKFPLPLTSGIKELMQEVSKTLDWELGSFNVDYKDEDGDWILMARDDNVSEYLQLLNSLGSQATKLEVRKKVPDTTNICETCGSLKQ